MGECRGFPAYAELLAVVDTILGSLDEGVHVVDARGYTVFYNQAVQQLEGLTGEEVIGKHILEVFPSLSTETSTFLKVLRSGQPIASQQQTYRNFKGQEVVTVNTTLPIWREGELIGAVEISRDITAVKALTDRMANLQAELLQGRHQGRPRAGEEQALYTFEQIIGASPQLKNLLAQARKAARINAPILVYGETGTGKELLVHAIHRASPRAEAPFISQNCGAIPESLLEGLLFGTVKGAFTGATDRPGLFELAHGGTLFLDEINSMDLEIQVKLLRVLQDGTVRRVGDSKVRTVDVRIIAATNVDPYEAVTRGQLRPDLFYRLNVVSLPLPPLRERQGDIPLLVQHFIAKYRQRYTSRVKEISPEALAVLERYSWPGNVRELEGVIAGAMTMADSERLEVVHLPQRLLVNLPRPSLNSINMPLPRYLLEVERELVAAALAKHKGNISRAAEELGIPRQTLQYRINKLGLA